MGTLRIRGRLLIGTILNQKFRGLFLTNVFVQKLGHREQGPRLSDRDKRNDLTTRSFLTSLHVHRTKGFLLLVLFKIFNKTMKGKMV